MNIRKYITAAILISVTAASATSCDLENEEVREETIPLEAVSSLDANLLSTDLKIRIGNENKVHYRVYKSLAPEVSQNGGKLSIISGEGKSTRMFSDNDDNYIEITLDKKELGNIDIEASSGDILVDGFDLGGKVKTSSGDIEIKNVCDGKDIIIEASSGDIDLKECSFRNIQKKTSSGNSDFSNVKAESFILESESGNTDISGSDICNIESESHSGDVDINLKGKRDNCNYDLSVGSGNIKLNGGKYESGLTEDNNADKTVKIKTSSGDITVNIE